TRRSSDLAQVEAGTRTAARGDEPGGRRFAAKEVFEDSEHRIVDPRDEHRPLRLGERTEQLDLGLLAERDRRDARRDAKEPVRTDDGRPRAGAAAERSRDEAPADPSERDPDELLVFGL